MASDFFNNLLDFPSIRSPGHKSDECPNLSATCSHWVADDRDGIASLVRNCSAMRQESLLPFKGLASHCLMSRIKSMN